jgi:hypothetical protein
VTVTASGTWVRRPARDRWLEHASSGARPPRSPLDRLAVGTNGPHRRELLAALDRVPPTVRVLDAAGTVHVAPSCCRALHPTRPFSFLADLPTIEPCPECLPFESGPVAQAIDFLCATAQGLRPPSSWADIAEQRTLLADPVGSLVPIQRPGWSAPLDELLTRRYDTAAASCRSLAARLDVSELHLAIAAQHPDLVRQSPLEMVDAATSALLGRPPPRRWPLSAAARRRRRTGRELAAALSAPTVTVLVVAAHPEALALGSALERVVDLATFDRFQDRTAICALPPLAAEVVVRYPARPVDPVTDPLGAAFPPRFAAAVIGAEDAALVSWAASLWCADQRRPLEQHLVTARRLARRTPRPCHPDVAGERR